MSDHQIKRERHIEAQFSDVGTSQGQPMYYQGGLGEVDVKADPGLSDNQQPPSYYPMGAMRPPPRVLPSQLLQTYQRIQPPPRFSSEDFPVAGQSFGGYEEPSYRPVAQAGGSSTPSFAQVANDMINKSLRRRPGGTSVVEPDSVLGDSGRLYHGYKEGKYMLPNDAAEQDRLDFQHKIFRLLFDDWLALAPLSSSPRYVLDVGTGTGIWATDFAEQNPASYVIGTDLSAIQPAPRVPNCTFIKDDAEAPWYFADPFPDHSRCQGNCQHWISFDYIHLRLMFTCFDDPRTVMKRAYDNLSPGGWIEFQESSMEYCQENPDYQGTAGLRYTELCIRGAAALGRDLLAVLHYQRWLEEIGFINVNTKIFRLPQGPWAQTEKLKHIGEFHMRNVLEAARGFGWKMLTAAGMTAAEIEDLVAQVQSEIWNRNSHAYNPVYVIYGQKPAMS
ncbi:putative S-adenosyl-L-methionine-dependent methyltransferase [Seiridium cardinale]